MGRAIVREPSVFLMDEPLSNLDAKLRVQMRGEILELQRRLGTTTMYVTHDQFEAMTLGDRVAVLRAAELQQVGAPKDIYDKPANLFVAGFLGNPPMNLLEVKLVDEGGRPGFRLGKQELHVDDLELQRQPRIREYVGRTVAAGVRPESLGIPAAEQNDRRCLSGVFRLGEVLGSDLFGHFSVDGARPLSATVRAQAHDVEDLAELQDLSGAEIGTIIVGRFLPDVELSVGDPLEVSLKRGSLRFFDPDSGLAL
jgi:multiple sugar transport system ATP-binding protein